MALLPTVQIVCASMFWALLNLLPCEGISCKRSKVKLFEGDPACLPCDKFFSRPSVKNWFKEDRHELKSEKRFFVDELGTLFFSYVVPSDSGIYKCRENDTGKVLNVTVGAKNEPETKRPQERKPSLLWGSSNYSVFVGESLQLVCVIGGRPVPNITWSLRDNLLEQGVHTEGFKSTLNLSRVTANDAGTYVCHGSNAAGNVSDVFSVSVADRNIKLLVILAAAGLLCLVVFVLAINVFAHRWWTRKKERQKMMKKEKEGYRMVHVEERGTGIRKEDIAKNISKEQVQETSNNRLAELDMVVQSTVAERNETGKVQMVNLDETGRDDMLQPDGIEGDQVVKDSAVRPSNRSSTLKETSKECGNVNLRKTERKGGDDEAVVKYEGGTVDDPKREDALERKSMPDIDTMDPNQGQKGQIDNSVARSAQNTEESIRIEEMKSPEAVKYDIASGKSIILGMTENPSKSSKDEKKGVPELGGTGKKDGPNDKNLNDDGDQIADFKEKEHSEESQA